MTTGRRGQQRTRMLKGWVSALVWGLALPLTAAAQPTVEITWDQLTVWSESSFTLTFTFSEAVEGFTAEDLDLGEYLFVSPARKTNFQALSATTYTLEVTPDIVDGERVRYVYVIVEAGAAQAVADGADNAAAALSISMLPTNREVLEALYHATDGPKWTRRDNWLSDKPLREWYGVTTENAIDPDAKVTVLQLPDNKLSGTLPPILSHLDEIKGLWLHNNKLSGTLPPAWAFLDTLEDLKLHGNANLRGAIPSNFPTDLPHLRELAVQHTQVTVPYDPAFKDWEAVISSGTQRAVRTLSLAVANRHPWGLFSDGVTLWVGDTADAKVYAYRLVDGTHDADKDMALHTDNRDPRGLWSDGATLWVVDESDRKVYAYTLADGTHDADKSFVVSSDVLLPKGVWSNGTNIWVADGPQERLVPHRLDTGEEVFTAHVNLPVMNDTIRGIWWNDMTLWVADAEDTRVYAYTADPNATSYSITPDYDPAASWILTPDNRQPRGLWYDATTSTLWVADAGQAKVYAYSRVQQATGSTPPPPRRPGGSSGSSGSGDSRRPTTANADAHGNTSGQATSVPLRDIAPWAASTPGQINSATDMDYFALTVPHAGVLVAETTGRTDTVGTVWQDGVELGRTTRGGAGRNFRLVVPVEAGEVLIAVAGNGRRTGAYRLLTRLLVGFLENPGADSFQSGIGVVSGWTCAAETVEIVLETADEVVARYEAAYGTARADTEGVCGDADTGFGLLFNWNLLGDGAHAVTLVVDDIELARAPLTVTTLGEEFVREAAGECVVADFPLSGESTRLVWQQSSQNFALADGPAPAGENRPGTVEMGFLENPEPDSYQSGIGLISGWVCEAEEMTIEIETEAGETGRFPAAYGTARADTAATCGDADTGFGLLFNWNLLGDGVHTVVALADGAEVGRATVRVTTLGEEFVQDVTGECVVKDFPSPGERVRLVWLPSRQNFVITEVE